MTENTQYRFYGFGNYYLSSLQQGLQAGHTVSELYVKHKDIPEKFEQVMEWGQNHKTMVLLKGGNSANLKELFKFFKSLKKQGMPYAYAKFNEDKQSLNKALTYVGIVLPDDVYDTAAQLRQGLIKLDKPTKKNPQWKIDLIKRINQYGLAN